MIRRLYELLFSFSFEEQLSKGVIHHGRGGPGARASGLTQRWGLVKGLPFALNVRGDKSGCLRGYRSVGFAIIDYTVVLRLKAPSISLATAEEAELR